MGVRGKPNGRTEGGSRGVVAVRSQVAGEALLTLQVVDPRYTAQQVVDGLNSGELTYGAGHITRSGLVVAKYHLTNLDDRLVNFRISA
jgi:hypothetical protein